jgi:hypothetical protein
MLTKSKGFGMSTLANSVRFDDSMMWVGLVDGRQLGVPLGELRSGEVVAVPGEAVFERLLSREPGYWKDRL